MPNTTLSDLKEHTDNISKFSNQRVDKFYSLVRTMITIFSGMIAVLVSLKQNQSDIYHKILFTSSIGLLSLAILFAAILLYTEVIALRHLENSLTEHTLKLLNGTAQTNFWIESGNPGRLFGISKWGMSISFLLSLILLTIYSY